MLITDAVDGYMTGWSDWGQCTNPCEENGKKNWKYRTRACVEPSYGGAPCVGAKKVKARCNKTPCEGQLKSLYLGFINEIYEDLLTVLNANFSNISIISWPFLQAIYVELS